jgi:hypothetical protein
MRPETGIGKRQHRVIQRGDKAATQNEEDVQQADQDIEQKFIALETRQECDANDTIAARTHEDDQHAYPQVQERLARNMRCEYQQR